MRNLSSLSCKIGGKQGTPVCSFFSKGIIGCIVQTNNMAAIQTYYFKRVGNLDYYIVSVSKSVYWMRDSEFKTCLEEY